MSLSSVILGGLEVIHALQKERGYTALVLSMGTDAHQDKLKQAQHTTDQILQNNIFPKEVGRDLAPILQQHNFLEGICLAKELQRIPLWLSLDRQIIATHMQQSQHDHHHHQQQQHDHDNNSDNDVSTATFFKDSATVRQTYSTNNETRRGIHESPTITLDEEALWIQNLRLVEKFNPRIDVLIRATVNALTERLQKAHNDRQQRQQNCAPQQVDKKENSGDGSSGSNPNNQVQTNGFLYAVPELFQSWLEAKEALGRQRAFFCAGGSAVPHIVKLSFKLRQQSMETIDTKERKINRVLSLEAGLNSDHAATMTAPKALHRLLEQLSRLEYSVLRSFGVSTSLSTIHKLLADGVEETKYDVMQFFSASTAPIDFLLSFAKALAAASLASSSA
jgi:hypothetical protein